ncbi:hypothetical protein CK203_086552 [Vitis vinifera]|uniref:Retrotransposon gag domain-containing protein n=1 Tax=Vitis vinifera TaxID=29760 RepID=A0A438FJB7_VITVI|nr:hypothetical protein CK203_086552 [Vitis vinifera]
MQDNESLREFVKRFGQAILQVEAYSMDVVLQIFKRGICPGTPFFESLAKKPPITMDDLFRRANKYSMLEDDGRLIEGRKGQVAPERPPLTPLSISYEKLFPMIQDMSDFRCLHYLVERLIRAGHLKQYLRSDVGGRNTSQNHNTGAPRAPAVPKAVINYINGDPSDEEYDSKRKRQKLLRAASHCDALILSLEIGDFDVRLILVDPGSSADLVKASVISHMGHSLTGLENPGRILSEFNGSSTTSLGDIRTWLHYMKVIPSTYHQMVSFLTKDGQIDLYGSQLAARQCYQIAREAGTSQENASLPESSPARDQ